MSAINVKFDNNLTFSNIEVLLKGPQESETGEDTTGILAEAQTMIQGVCVPLIAIGEIVFDIKQILELSLYSVDSFPSMRAVLCDSNHYLENLQIPGRDNEIRLQILPPFENAYKKINLNFFIDSISISGDNVTVSGKYKVPELYNSQFISLGEVNTYELFEKIATNCKLGFATNCESNDIDKRYVYANNTNYKEIMEKQIRQSGSKDIVYDYWIDFWNNINLADIRERYYTKDPDEEMSVWIQTGKPVHTQKDDPIEVAEQIAVINNNPNETGPLKASEYNIITNTGKATSVGTDQVYTCYKEGVDEGEIIDTLVQDGNVQKDVFLKYEYVGENIGDFDYLIAKTTRRSFMDIINCNKLEVVINFPSLALMRGHQCVFHWYDNDFSSKNVIKYLEDPESSVQVDQTEELEDPDAFIINKQISGQYLISGVKMEYNRGKWRQTLILMRPQDEQHKYLESEE